MADHGSTDNPSVMGLDFYPRQWEAVAAPIGPVLVLAGPGSGKTRCLAGRVGFLIEHHEVNPKAICAITFTNKAAEEIKSRLRIGLGNTVEELTLGTIHSLCLDILRTSEPQTGLTRGFGIADEDHQKLILKRLNVYEKRHSKLLGLMGKRRLQNHRLSDSDEQIFQSYTAQLSQQNMVDYDGILSFTRALLEDNPEVLTTHRRRWDHILVDEFQDLDPSQYAIIKLLASGHRSLFTVGDDDQSIFAWRSADPKLISTFMKDFQVQNPVVLNLNCRCSKAIFEAARRVLPSNTLGFEKQISAQRDSPFPVMLRRSNDENEEATWLVEDLKRDQTDSGLAWGNHAVLYRTHNDGKLIEQALIEAGIPCQLGRGRSLADEPMIAQLIAALRVVISPDSWVEIERLAKSALDDVLLTEIKRRPGETILSQARAYAMNSRGENRSKAWRFVYQVENLRSLGQNQDSLQGVVDTILAQGLGRYESSLEKRHDQLCDPMMLAEVSELARLLLETESAGKSVFITSCQGLEIPIRQMISRVLPRMRLDHYDPGVARDGDLIIDLTGGQVGLPLGVSVFRLFENERLRTTRVFKALQCVESLRSGRVFEEYICFDTETTGKDTEYCDIIELAAVKIRHGKVVGEFHSLISTDQPISPGASEVHGYRDDDLRGQPRMAEVWPRFREFVGRTGLVVHNGHMFDIPLVERLTQPCGGVIGMVFFDTLPMAKSLIQSGGLRLVDLASLFGINPGRSHRALDDSRCLAEVFERLLEEWATRTRKTSLSSLLGLVALGAAIENVQPKIAEDKLLVELGNWRALGPRSTVLDDYAAELETLEIPGPPASVLLDRLGGQDLRGRALREQSPHDRYPDAYARLTSLVSSVNAPSLQDAIRTFLDTLALSRSDGFGISPDRVSLLTHHSTKGLEFSRVYIIGVEDDQRDLQSDDPNTLPEARRLVYVAMTRAKDRLCLTYCESRNGRPLQGTTFLQEMGLILQDDTPETASS